MAHPRTNHKLFSEASIVVDQALPIERVPLLQAVCDAYIELGRLAVIATLLGFTAFIVTYVVKNHSLTDALVAEPLAIEIGEAQ